MSVLILFRRAARPNRFRDLVIECIRSGAGDEILLCSGFFQELFRGSRYRASQERQFAQVLAASGAHLTTLGVHNASWLPSYHAFVAALRAAGARVSARRARSFHWHAKVFVYSRRGEPLLAVVGSSNLTRNAFGDTAPHNYEADVVLWDKGSAPFDPLAFGDGALLAGDADDVLLAPYDPELNRGLSMQARLRTITSDVFAVPFAEF